MADPLRPFSFFAPVISGAFSVTHQAIHLGFLPRLRTLHTSEKAAGQIYIPSINWGLLAMVLVLVLASASRRVSHRLTEYRSSGRC